ncbi:MAG: BlaI/MecI/CopY family transcriptional regulator [Clostridia bacterium]|nr:BlaI/MecI/CopY family transcriptional regulator [Clostridia bacterium]MBQ3092569.1 BlaI/MecI/CopY family transcriptional regulator [Clostridia bacterium]MBQ9924671.1 BlaI/MecI/CopY family transcriptional regulator [Clostridia bacterium]
MQALTRSELEIMTVLWEAGRPLSRAEIIEFSPKKTWKASSIHIMLNGLLDKGAIEVAGFTKIGTHYGRTFAPTMDEAQYAVSQIRNLSAWQKAPAQTAQNVISELLGSAELEDETLDALEALLQKKRKH